MADIAFLLLVFFLMATTIQADKGLTMLLPPKNEQRQQKELNDRNVFKILVNYKDELLVEDKPMEIDQLKEEIMVFLTNRGQNPDLSDSPQEAVVSIKTDRGTTYETYINVLDEAKAAYHQLRADHVGITLQDYLNLKPDKNPKHKKLYERAKEEFPMRISEAEPTDIGK